MEDSLAKISRLVDTLSVNERKLADFILENAPLLRDYSSQQLAEVAGVSQSSVVKFSQKLGYKGYPRLKLAISEDIARNSMQRKNLKAFSAKPIREQSIFVDLARLKGEIISEVAELNNSETLLSVVRTIEEANRIQFVAAGDNLLVVKDFALKLMIMGKSVFAESDMFMQRANLASIKRGDTLVALSLSGQNQQVIEIAQTAKEVGALVISLTKYDVNPLSLLADLNLFSLVGYADTADVNVAPHIVERVALQHVIDTLYISLISRNSQMQEILTLNNNVNSD